VWSWLFAAIWHRVVLHATASSSVNGPIAQASRLWARDLE
jgi:hypothetical protein